MAWEKQQNMDGSSVWAPCLHMGRPRSSSWLQPGHLGREPADGRFLSACLSVTDFQIWKTEKSKFKPNIDQQITVVSAILFSLVNIIFKKIL